MLALLTVMDQMQATLIAADAPARQLTAVAEWHSAIAVAVSIGSQYRRPAGMGIDGTSPRWGVPNQARFLCGHITHAAWRDLCRAVLSALHRQCIHANQLIAFWNRRAQLADTHRSRTYAIKQARIAESWSAAASAAKSLGRALVVTEDNIQVPVGRVIKRVGFHEVATEKRYHQRGTR